MSKKLPVPKEEVFSVNDVVGGSSAEDELEERAAADALRLKEEASKGTKLVISFLIMVKTTQEAAAPCANNGSLRRSTKGSAEMLLFNE